MNIDDAAQSLDRKLKRHPLFTAVGVGEENGSPALFLYVSDPKRFSLGDLKHGYNGFPVLLRKMGTPKLAVGVK